ncbi:MAG: glutamate--tRNA ligase [Candidatus Diapherotrites archaeon]|uniref:Glutamate--tRNA ligase n=1 Tax=Candidatus Iainarchaeum sp. TaxID=3101447 RepID=A0A8T3YJK7_9ARCH|nr:glutamate--tRNA ligase [Candidatus Diapherotrites archaeon]
MAADKSALEKVRQDAHRYAVKNAFEHGGRAEIGALIGKLKALHKEMPVPEIMPTAIEVVKKVNSMSSADIEQEFRSFEGGYELKPQKGREGLPELEWAESGSRVVTRFAPNPNGPPHLGNARAAFLSYAYAEKYGGKFILRFEDTDPKVKKPMENPEEAFREDLEWLGIKVDEVYFASDRLPLYYSYMRKITEAGHAYVCMCKSGKWKENIDTKRACPCRDKDAKHQMELFEKMISHELKEGEAVLRIKTDLKHPDPSVRDWWIARIVDRPEHPRATGKDFVWPSFMFESAIDDHDMGITLVLRGQEHAQNSTKQKYLYDYFGWEPPHAIHFGRLSIGEMVLSKSRIREGVESGEYEGWDDIRLGTLRALRRRGFRPEALQKVIIDSGLTTSDANISVQKISAYNRDLIKEDATRTTYLLDPVKLEVPAHEGMEIEKDGKSIELPQGMHEFLVSAKEIKAVKEPVLRLRNAYNVRVENREGFSLLGKFIGKEAGGKQVVSWVYEMMDLELKLPDGSRELGIIEAMDLKKGQYLYLEKKGFCIIDSADGKRPVAWFCHE